MWVLEVNGRSVGMLQDYLVGDHPEFALLTARPEAVGLDYLVGDPTWVGVGIGTRMLWTFLRDVVRPHYPQAREYFAAPDHRNAGSLRVLDKLGFTRGLWFDEPQRAWRCRHRRRLLDGRAPGVRLTRAPALLPTVHRARPA